jgi:CheY-like chemotaxis protein/HPt (histidine-containing phosphotransfer) domain-containing protein
VPIVVLEDSPLGRLILQQMLEGWSLSSRLVPDPDAALAALRHAQAGGQPMPLLLVDAALPSEASEYVAEVLRHDPALAGVRVIWMCPATPPAFLAASPPGWARVSKPVVASALFEAIQQLTGPSGAPVKAAGPVATPAARPLHLLVADDSPVNQKVIAGLLRRAGHTFEVVGTGALAVKRTAEASFDAVLMDVQMPELDGLEATRAIRRREEGGPSRLPILALTAQAMSGDDQRCFEAGMDAYVTKPVDPARLSQALARLTGGVAPPPPFELPTLMAQVAGDEALLRVAVEAFLADLAPMAQALDDALGTSDGVALEVSAHRLKGALLQLAAGPASRRARAVEEHARAKALPLAAAQAPQLHAELERLSAALKGLCSERGWA